MEARRGLISPPPPACAASRPRPAPPPRAVAAGLRGTAPGDAPDAYLGLLSAEDELKLFGYVTNTRCGRGALVAVMVATPLLPAGAAG